MTGTVVTVDRITPYQEIDRLLSEHRISGMPVLKMGREVVGVVSEADLLAAEDETSRQARMSSSLGRRRFLHRDPPAGLTAGTLMTAPAVTIGPDATIPAAARLMNTHHVRRLPVVDEDGTLVGIVSRRDLLSVFLRPDADIIRDVGQVLGEIAGTDPKDVVVTVHHGVVTLTGTMRLEPGDRHDLVPLAVRLVWDIDGVVDVVNRLTETKAEQHGQHRLTAQHQKGPRFARPFLCVPPSSLPPGLPSPRLVPRLRPPVLRPPEPRTEVLLCW